VTTIEFFEKARLARNILPASVLDRSYGEQAEMTKQQVIEKSLAEMSQRWCWAEGVDDLQTRHASAKASLTGAPQ